jgi:hypothetical protein
VREREESELAKDCIDQEEEGEARGSEMEMIFNDWLWSSPHSA